MSFQTVVLIAASVIVGIACTATVSTEVFARVPAGTTRLHRYHHRGTFHHSGQVRHPTSKAALSVLLAVRLHLRPRPLLRSELHCQLVNSA
jgi:hypothetical protein